jgi:hypothetical protein
MRMLGGWLGSWLGSWIGRIATALLSRRHGDIIKSCVTILQTGTAHWCSVTNSRVISSRQKWPYLLVFSDGDISRHEHHIPFLYDRMMMVTVVAMVNLPGNSDTETVEDRMDSIAVDIENKLTADALGAYVYGVDKFDLVSTKMNVILTESMQMHHAELTMSFHASYTTMEGDLEYIM